MDRRFDARLSEMLAQAEAAPELIDGFLGRPETFVHPFSAALGEPERRRHTVEYLTGLLSKLGRKTGEGIAHLLDQERQGLQKWLIRDSRRLCPYNFSGRTIRLHRHLLSVPSLPAPLGLRGHGRWSTSRTSSTT